MVGMFKNTVLVLLAVLCLHSVSLRAEETAALDRIVLKNGSTLLGTVTSYADGAVNLETDFAGTLAVAQDQIVSLQTNTAMVLQMADGTVLESQPLLVENEQLLVTGTVPGTTFSLADLSKTDPEPWEQGLGYQWTGLVNFAWALVRGNTETDELDYRLDTKLVGIDDRYTLRFDGEIDEANDQKNADNWTLLGKYDRFLEDRWYWGWLASAESDEFADLDLRYYTGPYAGRHIYTEPVFDMEAEIGLVYVNENFITAEDQDYPGANWSVHMKSNYLGGDSRMYLDHIGIWNLDETSDIILNTTFGLAFPLLFSLEGAAEVMLEYDSGAVEGVEELDQTYRFRIGYTW
mgnify:FL=1